MPAWTQLVSFIANWMNGQLAVECAAVNSGCKAARFLNTVDDEL